MTTTSVLVVALVLSGVALAIWDISAVQARTIVVYTTPALRDLLEQDIIPAYKRETGQNVAPVYVAAGQQYNRLRMSGDRPEADMLLHASPLYLEKGAADGRIAWTALGEPRNASFLGEERGGAHAWRAFAWSPLVEVFPEGASAPDLATTPARFGFPHPLLANNGVYNVLFFEELAPATGERLLAQTRIQPTNARANIGGIADGSFQLTLGYEAVVRFYQAQGAAVAYDAPLLAGERVTTRVIFSAALIDGARHPLADDFFAYLFTPDVQSMLAERSFRPTIEGIAGPADALDLDGVRIIDIDWTRWRELEAALPRYEVRR